MSTEDLAKQTQGTTWTAYAYSPGDVLFGDPTDPVSLNQFAYGQENPVTMSDPTGMNPCDPHDPGYAECMEWWSEHNDPNDGDGNGGDGGGGGEAGDGGGGPCPLGAYCSGDISSVLADVLADMPPYYPDRETW